MERTPKGSFEVKQKRGTIATNRWAIAAAGVVLQVALSAVYAWSVFRLPLSRRFGWSISEVPLTFTFSIFVLGASPFCALATFAYLGITFLIVTMGCGLLMQNPPQRWKPAGWAAGSSLRSPPSPRDYSLGEALGTWHWWSRGRQTTRKRQEWTSSCIVWRTPNNRSFPVETKSKTFSVLRLEVF
jgi:hypothetical protein